MVWHAKQICAPVGSYRCERCGYRLIQKRQDPLPVCPACGNDTYFDGTNAIPSAEEFQQAEQQILADPGNVPQQSE